VYRRDRGFETEARSRPRSIGLSLTGLGAGSVATIMANFLLSIIVDTW
jgi:hypothetical protein